jgi:hypothetical protein
MEEEGKSIAVFGLDKRSLQDQEARSMVFIIRSRH